MHRKPVSLTVAAVIGMVGASAAGQTMTFSWIPDTIVITPLKPSATVAVTALMDTGGAPFYGFASDIFDVLATGFDATFDQVAWEPNGLLTRLTNGWGDPQANGDILDIDLFQLPEFFSPHIDKRNPIPIGWLTFSTTNFFPRGVNFKDRNHRNTAVYIDSFGATLPVTPIDPGVTFDIVPVPGTFAILALGCAAVFRRTR